MLAHLSLGVSDLTRATVFYDAVLSALRFERILTSERSAGYGLPGTQNDRLLLIWQPELVPPGPGFHVAFKALDHGAVQRFYAAALANGGRDAGPPGPGPHYGPDYYAA